MLLSVEKVDVTFGQTLILSQFSLSLAAGESVAIVGPSGSGKSSLLKVITGLLQPTAGRVVFDRVVVSDLSRNELADLRRKRIGQIFQDARLLPELSVEENVAITLIFDRVRRKTALRRARQALSRLHLEQHAEKRVDELSGGEAQRVALARAVTRDNLSLIVADEPTASLDVTTALAVAHLLIDHARSGGSALVLATHDPAVADLCDRVVDLRGIGVVA